MQDNIERWTGGMAQVVELPASTRETLSSNPVLPKKKKKTSTHLRLGLFNYA
jgi:hypothetical protein